MKKTKKRLQINKKCPVATALLSKIMTLSGCTCAPPSPLLASVSSPTCPEGERSRSLRVPVEGREARRAGVPPVSCETRASRGGALSQNGSDLYHKKAFVLRERYIKNDFMSLLWCCNSLLFRSSVFFFTQFKSRQNWHYEITF